jgi:carboxyl-terminal processing protease
MTRGTFIREAVQILSLPLKRNVDLPYKRPVPRSLKVFVQTAYEEKALTVFGDDLRLSRGITRSEAAQVTVELLNLKPEGTTLRFTDLAKGSPEEKAAQVAVEREWLKPIRGTMFGGKRVMTVAEAEAMLKAAAGITGIIESRTAPKAPTIVVKVKGKERAPLPGEELLRTVWQMVKDQYLYQEKISEEEAAYKAAEAIVQSLGDPYTTFMRPLSTKEFQSQIQGELSGIGAQVEYQENVLLIVTPLPKSPAEKAGLHPGDRILEVDGESLAGLDLLRAVQKVRGPKGSTAKLKVNRDGVTSIFTVVRDTIKIPEIDISMQGEVAVVKLVQFGQRTETELRGMMMEVAKYKVKGVVLDLRNNPGGLLHAAEIVLSNFLPKGSPVAQILSRDEKLVEVTADEPTIASGIPLVVLVNKGSASASEIVAGALQDAKRAHVIGTQTFGKGTVQQVVDFNNGSSLKVTIAEWQTPEGRKIQGIGVTPDIVVEQQDGRDEQLLRAMDVLR